MRLGISTDTYDIDGKETARSEVVPSLQQIEQTLRAFQGEILQTPPMFSAKKVGGKKLYDLARQGISIERQPAKVQLSVQLIRYAYPDLEIVIDCSKGTYIRSLAHDFGQLLGTGAHLSALTRTKSGAFTLEKCIPQSHLLNLSFDFTKELLHV
jgi:tRNA pseudouridine55 synthase